MALAESEAPLPDDVRTMLDDADDRIERFHFDHRDAPLPGFVPCDFVAVRGAIGQIAERGLTPGQRFVEWGSGLGVATCLASLAEFDAVGIEIEPDLVAAAEAFADDHGVEVEFALGSYVPEGGDELLDDHAADLDREVTWLKTYGASAYESLGLDPDDFDLVFAYPWPGEEGVIFDLFAEYAAVGALLLTYHGEDGVLLQRKVR